MAHQALIVAFSMIAAASPAFAASQEAAPSTAATPAPAASADARYCMRLEPVTGTRVELIKCWTRAEWAQQGVDVDQDWAREGVGIKEGMGDVPRA